MTLCVVISLHCHFYDRYFFERYVNIINALLPAVLTGVFLSGEGGSRKGDKVKRRRRRGKSLHADGIIIRALDLGKGLRRGRRERERERERERGVKYVGLGR